MKNSTQGKTRFFIEERARELNHIKERPFYGRPEAETFYNILKKKYNVLQVSWCGVIVSVVSYKKDSQFMFEALTKMFPQMSVHQKESPFTELVTTWTLPKSLK